MSSITPARFGPIDVDSCMAPPSTCLDGIPNRLEDATSSLIGSMAKRAIDLVGAIGGLICLAPIMGLIAVLIRLGSKGPILFRQVRLGRDGKPFYCLKFRTMVADAEKKLDELENLNESAGGVLFKIKEDPRVTGLGRILRKTSLDELPQLWNVLVGEMSLVGPRPLQLRDCDRLDANDPIGYQKRLKVLPGITGPWQVGGRSDVDSDRMMDLDLDYVDNWSLGLDLRIIARTVVVVALGRGAC
ncbi:sugar transferase (plasmid) [Tundrisphaera sp. TA3]|uniref:sugar transferase n=1 Tax=Tundrisphaera sp. TA3 TaxID=3435775 RepID=UPI003EBDA932